VTESVVLPPDACGDAMEEKQILQQKIEQCRRLIAAVTDALTIERLQARKTELAACRT